MSKHTPGPWRLSSESPNIIKRDYTNIGLGDSSGYLIASSMGHDNSGFYASVEEGLANARLIAAAPDLLNALIVLSEEADNFGVSGVYFNEKCMGHKGLDLAYAAIAKATGETP
jgi:hypothetical protein